MDATDDSGAVQHNGGMLRTGGLIAVIGVVALVMTGCAPDRAPVAGEPTPTVEPSPSESVTPTPEPSSAPDDIPLTLACTAVVSDDVIYQWGSGNWASDPNFAVSKGSSAAVIVAHGGTACGWVNLTSGEKLTVAVGEFAPELGATLKSDRASAASAVSDFGVDGYFATSGDIGQADAFTGPYWITATSSWFGAASDATQIVASAIDAAQG